MAVPADDLRPVGAARRVGPNAIIRVAEALREAHGEPAALAVFRRAGLERYLDAFPDSLVDEHEVSALQGALHTTLPPAQAHAVARDAGRRTADYLLAHRIPPPVQRLLKALPARAAAPVLLRAIRAHAWTFTGSGMLTTRAGPPVQLAIAGCPLCRGIRSDAPACDYYGASFERLFRVLVHPRSRAAETACQAQGADACTFQVDWRT